MSRIGTQQIFIERMKVWENIKHFGNMVKGSGVSLGYQKDTSVF